MRASAFVGWGAVAIAVVLSGCTTAVSPPTGPSLPATQSVITSTGPATEPTPAAVPQGVDTLPASHAGVRPTKAEITAVVADFVAHNSAGIVVAKVTDIKIARDSRGRWWVSVWAVPTDSPNSEDAIVYLYKDGATWHLFDLGTGIDNSELPKEVRSKL